jgi:hypothetical protein
VSESYYSHSTPFDIAYASKQIPLGTCLRINSFGREDIHSWYKLYKLKIEAITQNNILLASKDIVMKLQNGKEVKVIDQPLYVVGYQENYLDGIRDYYLSWDGWDVDTYPRHMLENFTESPKLFPKLISEIVTKQIDRQYGKVAQYYSQVNTLGQFPRK